MKLGACIGTDCDKLRACARFGFDYAEASVSSIYLLSDEEFENFRAVSEECSMPVEAANCFVLSEIKLVGEQRDEKRIEEYLEKALSRCAKLGMKTIIFGSGGARRIPDGMTKEEGHRYIVDFLRRFAGPIAAKYSLQIAIEPLCSKDDNCINSVAEGLSIAKQSGLPNVKVLGDIYHMVMDNDPCSYIATIKGDILHAHTSTPVTNGKRRVYMKPDDGFSQLEFMSALVEGGCPRCSIEAGTDDFEADAPIALKVMQDTLKEITQ